MPGAPGRQIVLQLVSDPRRLPDLRHAAQRLCPDADTVTRAHVDLVVTEAATNIMRHAYGGRIDQPLRLNGWRDGDTLFLELHHEGQPFDRDAQREARLPLAEGGYGLEILAGVTDAVEYRSIHPRAHVVRVTKHINSGENTPCN